MSIRRNPNRVKFTILSNDALNDERLSFAAVGLLSYVLSKPDNWIVRSADVFRRGGIGRGAYKTIMDELQAAGYATLVKERSPDGHMAGSYWDVSEIPSGGQPESQPDRESKNPTVGKPNPIVKTDAVVKTDKAVKTEKVIRPRPGKAQPATIPALKRREPKPLFDAFKVTFPTAAASVAGQFDSAATAAGLTAADWEAFVSTPKAAQDLADGYLTPRTAMTRFQAWAKGKGKSAGSRRTNPEWEAIHLAPSRKGYR